MVRLPKKVDIHLLFKKKYIISSQIIVKKKFFFFSNLILTFFALYYIYIYITSIKTINSRREVLILNKIKGSDYIIYLKDVFEDSKSLFLVTELCEGGELYDQIVDRSQTDYVSIYCLYLVQPFLCVFFSYCLIMF